MEGSIPFGPKAVNVKIVLGMHRAMPLSMQLAAALKNDIVRGIWKPGDVLPTIRELAQTCAKTSTKTARRALEILAAEGWTMPRRGVGSVVVERGMDVRKKGRILICGYGMGYSYYPMKFTFLLGQRLRTQGYGIHSIVGKRSDRAELRRLAAILKERWSLVLIMGSGAEERKLVVESGRPFALVGNGASLVSAFRKTWPLSRMPTRGLDRCGRSRFPGWRWIQRPMPAPLRMPWWTIWIPAFRGT